MNITAGKYNGRKIISPDPKITRPTLSKIRMGVFNTLLPMLGDFNGKSFLDVFGGSGIMGLEAISRGFSEIKVYEQNKKIAEIIKKNYDILGLKPNLIIGDCTKLIKKEDKFFDVVYVDPPYNSNLYETILPLVKGNIIVTESDTELNLSDYQILKQKKYGNTILTYIKNSF